MDSVFKIWSGYCKFYSDSFDGDTGRWEDACHCKDNIPEGSSWGICDEKSCPAMIAYREHILGVKGADIDGER